MSSLVEGVVEEMESRGEAEIAARLCDTRSCVGCQSSDAVCATRLELLEATDSISRQGKAARAVI